MTGGVRVDVRPFEDDDARVYVELARRAFERVPSERRPRDTVERIAHLHGDANPAGRALVALARVEGRVVGHVSALPTRHVDARGTRRVARQIGCFVVDPSAQGRGVGRALLGAITAAAGELVHAYPNARSAPVFAASGHVRCACAPARIAIGRRRARERTADLGGGWTARAIDAASALALASSSPASSRPGFVRDAAWFAWRFLDPSLVDAYRFASIAHLDHGEFVVALTNHVVRGVTFGVLADAAPTLDARSLPAAVRCATAFGASRCVYVTTNLPAVGGAFTTLGTRVPARFDPRPVVLYARPDDARELASATILTADWMGF